MLKDRRAIPDLMRILNDIGSEPRTTYRIRDSSARALGKLEDEAALPALYEAINNAPEWQVRYSCVDAISGIGSERDRVDRLLELFTHETDEVRANASKSLGYIGSASQDLALRDYIVEQLKERLSDKGRGGHYALPFVAHEAARSLHYIGTSEAIAVLKEWEGGKDLFD
jgi:HEAT repeat protein